MDGQDLSTRTAVLVGDSLEEGGRELPIREVGGLQVEPSVRVVARADSCSPLDPHTLVCTFVKDPSGRVARPPCSDLLVRPCILLREREREASVRCQKTPNGARANCQDRGGTEPRGQAGKRTSLRDGASTGGHGCLLGPSVVEPAGEPTTTTTTTTVLLLLWLPAGRGMRRWLAATSSERRRNLRERRSHTYTSSEILKVQPPGNRTRTRGLDGCDPEALPTWLVSPP